MNWKALVAGIVTILILGLAAQFAFLLTATWLTVQKNQGLIQPENLQMLNYIAGSIYATLAMAPGGYITAYFSKIRVVLHCLLVGAVTTFVSLATSMGVEHATGKGFVFIILGTVLVILGGLIWSWRNKSGSES